MALPVNSSIILPVIFLLILSPVLAVPVNTTEQFDPTGIGSPTVPYVIKLFIPTARMIHSDQINDQVNGPDGEVIFGTSFGLSTYNGTWSTRHRNLNNISEGLMDDYITALEYDHAGNLWIGYSGGIQIYNGVYYKSIRDQQLLKETRILDLQRWDNDMWIATGHAGIHRFRNGTWTWFQPMTKTGPGFYEINSMTLDTAGNSLLIATTNEGLWSVSSPDDPVRFNLLAGRDTGFGLLQHVKRDPLGGVYFFNATMVVHYDPGRGFVPDLTSRDLTGGDMAITDMVAAPDGRLFLATDNGIYIRKNGETILHLTRFEGVGTSPVVKTVNIDAENRVWFATPGYVGYYQDTSGPVETIGVELVSPSVIPTTTSPTSVPVTSVATTPASPAVNNSALFFSPDSPLSALNPIIDPIVRALRKIISGMGS
jgi:ligand-binding sensor domain-containing protein